MQKNSSASISIRILFVLFTLIIIGFSVYYILEKQRKSYEIDHRKAVELCEYGFQQFMGQLIEKLQNNTTPITGIEKTEYDGGWYKIDVATSRKDTLLTLTIISIGNKGTQTASKKEIISFNKTEIDGNSVWVPIKKK